LPDETVIDGEVVALDESGRPSFSALQNHGSAQASVVYFVFDLLVLLRAERDGCRVGGEARITFTRRAPQPILVGQFEFLEWTQDGHLRHSRFVGLKEDGDARESRR
jgi:ATP-dependent DNA ligase